MYLFISICFHDLNRKIVHKKKKILQSHHTGPEINSWKEPGISSGTPSLCHRGSGFPQHDGGKQRTEWPMEPKDA